MSLATLCRRTRRPGFLAGAAFLAIGLGGNTPFLTLGLAMMVLALIQGPGQGDGR